MLFIGFNYFLADGSVPDFRNFQPSSSLSAESPTGSVLALARALIAQGQLERAASELTEASRRDAGNPQPYLLLSQVYFRLGRESDARLAKETSMRLRQKNPGVLRATQGRPFDANK